MNMGWICDVCGDRSADEHSPCSCDLENDTLVLEQLKYARSQIRDLQVAAEHTEWQRAETDRKIAAWIVDHLKYHPTADQVILHALADGILERRYLTASAKVAGHSYTFDMECGHCVQGRVYTGPPPGDDIGMCRDCHGTGAVRVRRRHVPSAT